MVDLTNPDFKEGGPIEHAFSNWVFVFPAIVTIGLVGFFTWKLIKSLREKEKKKEEKKKLKMQRKEVKKKK